MHKFFLLTTFITTALAAFDGFPSKMKRTNDGACSSGGENSSVTVHYVEVGKDGLTYTPDRLNGVNPGDFVQFKFSPKNHTVTESSFDEPCKPLAKNLTREDRPGIRTGFVPISGNETFDRVFTIKVNDTKPIWLFCGQKQPKSHCQAGMVMVINEPTDPAKSLDQYKAKAAALPVDGGAAPPVQPPPATNTDAVTPPATTAAPPDAPTDTSTPTVPAGASAATTSLLLSTLPAQGAAPTQAPKHFVAVGGLALAGAMAFI